MARAWLDDSIAYERRDTADLERDAYTDEIIEAREHLAAIADEIRGLTLQLESFPPGRAPQRIVNQLITLHVERSSLAGKIEEADAIADRGGRL